MNKYISVKLGGIMTLLVIIILVPLFFSIHQFFVRYYTEQAISSLVTHGQYVEKMIRGKELNDPSIQQAASYNLMGSELVLTGDEGNVVLNTGVPLAELGRSFDIFFKSIGQNQVFEHVTEDWIIIGIPVFDSPLTGIFLYSSKQPIKEAIAEFRSMILLSGLGAILLTIGLTWALSKRMVTPLLLMKEVTQSLSKGNFNVTVPVNGKDEIAQLGKAINHLADDLHHLQNSRKEFLSSVSHELRTPLSYVKGYSQALEEGMLKTEEDRKKFIRVIRQEANRLTRLVEDLFDLTQMDEGQLRLLRKEVDVDQVIQKTLQTFRPTAEAKNIQCEYHTDKPLPIIEGDYDRLAQVMFNLLDNALRHTPDGGKITVETEVNDLDLNIVVLDTGSGIPEKELPYIWERFYRVDKSRARKLGGTGLGLAIVKQIVEGHQGSIQIKSDEGVGTSVTVKLPLIRRKGERR